MNTKKTKEYVKRGNINNLVVENDPTHEYMFYDILGDNERITSYKEEYLKSLNGNIFYKLITNKDNWYRTKGIYTPEENELFELGLVPIKEKSYKSLELFEKGIKSSNKYKAIRTNDGIIYIYIPNGLVKVGRTYISRPVIPINEDIYNIAKIENAKFNEVTTNDLSRYSEFFKVSDIPYMVKNETYLENKYKRNEITLLEYKQELLSYKKEEELVKSLRRH